MTVFDTIAAVSTPRGKGGIAVIRISGCDTRAILKQVFTPAGRSPIDHPRYASFGNICRAGGEVLDEGLALFFPSPASFTGEDVAEISCHGGALVTEAVLAAVLAAGARPARAGEFTARALANGKMTLTEAEALGDLLEAGTKEQLALARGGMEGKLANEMRHIYEELSFLLADVFARIDFPEEDLGSITEEELTERLSALHQKLLALSYTWQTGRAVNEGIKTVICGPANAGKSTLYNAIVGHDAAIVTDIAGTTRDVLSETVSFGGATLRLFDTAGLRETSDTVERIGIERTDKALSEAELVLAVLDGSIAPDEGTRALLARLAAMQSTVVIVQNKEDSRPHFPADFLADFKHVVRISAKSGEIEPLRALVAGLYKTDAINLRESAVVANARQYAALTRAAAALEAALTSLSLGFPLDAAGAEIEGALSAVGEVDGRAVDEDVVANIFSRFCVGK